MVDRRHSPRSRRIHPGLEVPPLHLLLASAIQEDLLMLYRSATAPAGAIQEVFYKGPPATEEDCPPATR